MTSSTNSIFIWILKLASAILLLQTLFFKFTGAPESIYIFTKLGMEPWGRFGIGSLELIAAILILIPKTTSLGALLALGIIAGAIFFHLTKLGIVVQNDGGELFILAVIIMLCCLTLLVVYKNQLLSYISFSK